MYHCCKMLRNPFAGPCTSVATSQDFVRAASVTGSIGQSYSTTEDAEAGVLASSNEFRILRCAFLFNECTRVFVVCLQFPCRRTTTVPLEVCHPLKKHQARAAAAAEKPYPKQQPCPRSTPFQGPAGGLHSILGSPKVQQAQCDRLPCCSW